MKIGIEKETVVYNEDFTPFNLDKKDINKTISLDYCDNHVEVVSKPHSTRYDALNEINNALNKSIFNNKYLWPLSQPAFIDYNESFNSLNPTQREYRLHLKNKYPKALMLTSGIHFNFSIENYEKEQYFELMKSIYTYLPVIIQFFSFTPFYEKGCNDEGLFDINKNRGYKKSISLRNSIKHGYYNEHLLDLDFNDVDSYLKSIKKAIDIKKINSNKELYSKIRLKNNDGKYYLELRFIDINPFTRLGVTNTQLLLLEKMICYLTNKKINNFSFENAIANIENVCINGLDTNITLLINGEKNTLHNHTLTLLNAISVGKEMYENLDLHKMMNIISTNNYTIKEFGKIYAHIKKDYKEPYENEYLELSTKILIKEALLQNKNVKILDETQSVILIDQNLIVQATKTNKDHYADVLMLENKYMTKKILQDSGINVPVGQTFLSGDLINYHDYLNKEVVVKPVNTNFGVGITILHLNDTLKDIKRAFTLAFEYDNRVIVETFFKGEEFRFLVINNQVISIVKRVPANIVGDGINTVKQLVCLKNSNPLRGSGYKKPVEKIRLGTYEIDFIKKQGYDLNTILKCDQILYLRENSNVSTGGDSIEVSDLIEDKYKQVAIDATKAMNVSICGVDMIIDKNHENYVIIEANFNPAIQMHTYPYYGIGKKPAIEILKLLER